MTGNIILSEEDSFYDTNGVYRSWKQNFDGGYAELKGEE